MSMVDLKFKRDQSVLKVFGSGENRKIKLITMSYLKTSGVEDDDIDHYSYRGTLNDHKLDESISRSKSKIFELAFCNPWDYFFTGTLDKTKYDRKDLKKWAKDLSQWIRNYNSKYGLSIKYLLVPELHSDGESWHMHGFIMGLPKTHLKRFILGDKMSSWLSRKVSLGYSIYNWLPYAEKFGFCDLEEIRSPEAISKYITKYINKELGHSVTELNANLYYRSQGLNTAKIMKKGTLSFADDIEPSFENKYCKVYWLDYNEQLLNTLENRILKEELHVAPDNSYYNEIK